MFRKNNQIKERAIFELGKNYKDIEAKIEQIRNNANTYHDFGINEVVIPITQDYLAVYDLKKLEISKILCSVWIETAEGYSLERIEIRLNNE